jgi:chorismate mutase-like protein
MKIIDWRGKIDAIDTALLHLLNLRTELALEVGRLKADEGVALRVPAREQEILTRMKDLNPGPLSNESIAKIYQVMLDESIATQVRHGVGKAVGTGPAASEPRAARHPKPGRRWRK